MVVFHGYVNVYQRILEQHCCSYFYYYSLLLLLVAISMTISTALF